MSRLFFFSTKLHSLYKYRTRTTSIVFNSVGYPDPDPNPHVFGL